MSLANYKYLLGSSVVGALGGLLFGFDTAVISGATQALTTEYKLSEEALGFTVSSALWGTVISSMFSGIPGDKIGARETLRLAALMYVISALGCAFAWDLSSLIFFRFIGGLGIGCSSVLGPVYIAEIAPAKWRGRLVGMFQVNVVLGILLAYLSNFALGTFDLGSIEWRCKLGISGIPALLFFIMLFAIPKSPRWLAAKGQSAEAERVLALVGVENSKEELAEIEESLKSQTQQRQALFCAKYKLPIMLAIALGMFNQLSGINAILYYLNDIFALAGFNKVSSDLQAVLVGATNLVFCLAAMALIDRLGRRLLLLVGSVGTALCMAGVAAIFFSHQGEWLLVWLLMGFIGFFSFSQGAVIWVYLSEIFPTPVRSKGQSLGSFTHWIMNALISWAYPIMAKSSGAYPFVFFAAMMALQFVVVWKFFPETKGISLEEMESRLGIAG